MTMVGKFIRNKNDEILNSIIICNVWLSAEITTDGLGT
jgi:hypothetical protein